MINELNCFFSVEPYAHKFLGATKFWPESGSGSSGNFQNIHDLLDTTMDLPAEEGADTPGGQDKPSVDVADLLRKFELFKQFDTVEDHSDHIFASRSSSAKQVLFYRNIFASLLLLLLPPLS